MSDAPSICWNFGRLEAELADMHGIADAKRTAFQSRLKNFQRLGFPAGLVTSKGKAAQYRPGEIALMAIAVEMTQLGLPPERVIRTLLANSYPLFMCLSMAVSDLIKRPEGFDSDAVKPDTDPLSMFLFFDPTALNALTLDLDPRVTPDLDGSSDTFFYGGYAVVRDNLIKWTTGPINRLSLINVTGVLDRLAGDGPYSEDDLEQRRMFFQAVHGYAVDRQHMATADDMSEFLHGYFSATMKQLPSPDDAPGIAKFVAAEFGLLSADVLNVLTAYISEQAHVDP